MGICENGKTLIEMVEERERIFEETGHAYGLKEMKLLDDDPVNLMKFQSRLIAGCVSARETGRLIAASPAALMMGELLFMVATPAGDVICSSHGLVGHIQVVPYLIKALADLNYEENPKIKEGDLFSCNDGLYGPPHASDCYLALPIFHEGELIAWAVSMNHIAEAGAVVAGNLPAFSASTFTDGFVYPPTKSGENFQQHRWWEQYWHRRTRLGRINVLDDKMRVAGAVKVHEIVHEAVNEFGIDYFKQGIKEILERERRQLMQLIKTQAVPGKVNALRFHCVRYKGQIGKLFPNSDRDWLFHFPLEMTIDKDCVMHPDYEGLNTEADFHGNIHTPGAIAIAALGQWPMVAHSSTTNTSLSYAMKYNIPEGSMGNPKNPFAAVSMGVGVVGYQCVPFQQAFSTLFFSKGFYEECFLRGATPYGYGLEGIFEDGERWAGGNFSCIGADSTGGQPYKDGSPCNGALTNPESDHGEVELFEFLEPTQLNIGRKLVPDYCGHGKFRGGLGMSGVQLITKPGRHLAVSIFASVSSECGATGTGDCGGYPALGSVTYFYHGTNMYELLEKGVPYPSDFIEAKKMYDDGILTAESVDCFTGDISNVACKDGDLYIWGCHANSGWGDPLERFYDLVEEDVKYGWLSENVVKSVYGTVVNEDGKVKNEESDALRKEMKNTRKEKSMDTKDWWKEERKKMLDKDLHELITEMYRDCMTYEKFSNQLKSVWQLPDDYSL
jgi:N-methylhydantoinase B/acetone carboxylase alpha subunit